jgi:hypothetical protein
MHVSSDSDAFTKQTNNTSTTLAQPLKKHKILTPFRKQSTAQSEPLAVTVQAFVSPRHEGHGKLETLLSTHKKSSIYFRPCIKMSKKVSKNKYWGNFSNTTGCLCKEDAGGWQTPATQKHTALQPPVARGPVRMFTIANIPATTTITLELTFNGADTCANIGCSQPGEMHDFVSVPTTHHNASLAHFCTTLTKHS